MLCFHKISFYYDYPKLDELVKSRHSGPAN